MEISGVQPVLDCKSESQFKVSDSITDPVSNPIKVSAPGSLMLFGEHAVLNGHHALVAAIDQFITITLTKRHDHKIKIVSDLGEFECECDKLPFELEKMHSFTFILTTLLEIQKKIGSFCNGFELEVQSDFSHEIGFGSSAAVVVATLNALSLWLNLNFTKENIFELGRNIIQKVQGKASGADIAASVYGGILYYSCAPLSIKKIDKFPPIVAVYSGYKTKTKDVLQKVEKRFLGKNENHLQNVYSAMEHCTQRALEALNSENWQELGLCMNVQQGFLNALGVSDEKLENILFQMRKDTGILGAKISGSGLGDCLIGLGSLKDTTENKDTIEKNLKETFKDEKIRLIPVRITQRCLTPLRSDLRVRPQRCQTPFRDLAKIPQEKSSTAFAPANIALCKYWGKRDTVLNLPVTNSLSISLGNYGSWTKVTPLQNQNKNQDIIILNDKLCSPDSSFAMRLKAFLDLFRRGQEIYFEIDTKSNLPIAAGLASSASGFAACVKALNKLYRWNLTPQMLSLFARLGSGSACRSLWHGFVEWEKGCDPLGFDSVATHFNHPWKELRVGLLILDSNTKSLSSREAMQRTVTTSDFYKEWPSLIDKHLMILKQAIKEKDFKTLGETSETNALCMHALMQTSIPPIVFSSQKTLEVWNQIWNLRKEGLEVYFTQDAGPNLKLLFLEKDLETIVKNFKDLIVIAPFLHEQSENLEACHV